MVCPICNNEMQAEETVCPKCGHDHGEKAKAEQDQQKTEQIQALEEVEKQPNYLLYAKASIIGAVVPLGIGFYKMLVYKNSEEFWEDHINAYVGADAYNFIINANYASAWFILALLLVTLGSAFLICYEINKGRV